MAHQGFTIRPERKGGRLIMFVFFLSEINVPSKKVRKRRKKKGNEAREAKYMENTPTIDAGNIDITTIANTFPLETKPALNKKSHMDVSRESFLSSMPRERERTLSRTSTMHDEDFWERHFGESNSISWKRFRAAFLEDYGCVIQEFAPQRIHWILTIVHKDIFASADDIHKLYYDKFCGKSHHPDRLWVKIKEYASERIFREGVIESMFE